MSSYAGMSILLRTDNKIIVRPKPKFYYSFAFVVQALTSSGNSHFGYTTFQFCAEYTFETIVGLSPPDWAAVSNASIAQVQPPKQLRCLHLDPCFADVCAAHFAIDSQREPVVSGRPMFIDVIYSSVDEKFVELLLQSRPAPSGVICSRLLFGPNLGLLSQTNTSAIYTVCLRARATNVVSPSNAVCISAKVVEAA
jgi:hypothetical protein